MRIICFDLSSGGVSAAVFDSQLDSIRVVETGWPLEPGATGAARISVEVIVEHIKHALRALNAKSDNLDAICFGAFMHNCVLLDDADRPLTQVFTWLDRSGLAGIEYVRSRLGDRFHSITGCRYHPMFPIFKLAAMRLNDSEALRRMKRIVSIKALLLHRLTGSWIEDYGTASASGLCNLIEGDWDREILEILDLERTALPSIASRADIAGYITKEATAEFGLAAGISVITGSGDGFLASLGAGCDVPAKVAVSLGTSAAVRQTLNRPVGNPDSGTFCYRATKSEYLLGCAGSNGGNVLDWGRQILGEVNATTISKDIPIFLPLLHGERSPEWDPNLRGSWHGLTASHTAAELARSILEGVIFNLAHYIEIVQTTSGERATDLVLSGNGFLHPAAAPLLAHVTGTRTWVPKTPGEASLRGAGVCTLQALGLPVPLLHVDRVSPVADRETTERYSEYRRIRASSASAIHPHPL